MKNLIPIGALVLSVVTALMLNKCEVPDLTQVSEVIKTVTKTVTNTVKDTVYQRVAIPYTIRVHDTIRIKEIQRIKEDVEAYVYPDPCDTAMLKNMVAQLEKTSAENIMLIDDKNEMVNILSEVTNDLWMEKNKTQPKSFKHAIGASYGVLIGSQPIYHLTYETPLTKRANAVGGVIWNGKPGVSVGIKILF